MKRKNPHIGSSFDSFLKEEGIYKEVKDAAIKQVIEFELEDKMKKKKIKRKNTTGTE